MTQMPPALYERYRADPNKVDEEVRSAMNVPVDCYYTVTTWPEHLAGRLFVDRSRHRAVKSVKISKSDQRPA